MNITEVKSSEWSISLAGLGLLVEGIEDIKQCLSILLYTRKGTDPLRPDFGCGAIDRLDKPITSVIPGMTKDIIEAVLLYEPRIDMSESRITHKLDGSQITFTLYFKIKNSVDTGQQNITYGFN